MKDRWKWAWMLPLAALALSLGCNLPIGDAAQDATPVGDETALNDMEDIPLPDGSPLTEEQAARLREALLTETEDQRPDLLRLLDRPDAFCMIELLVEGVPVRRESWFYFRYLTQIDLVDGQVSLTIDLIEPPLETIFPAWYDPQAFPAGMSGEEAIAAATTASPAETIPEAMDIGGLGEELAAGEILVGDQIILGIFEGRLVYVETVPLFPEEAAQ